MYFMEMDGTYGKNGRVKNSKNDSDKGSWKNEEKKTVREKVEDTSGKISTLWITSWKVGSHGTPILIILI